EPFGRDVDLHLVDQRARGVDERLENVGLAAGVEHQRTPDAWAIGRIDLNSCPSAAGPTAASTGGFTEAGRHGRGMRVALAWDGGIPAAAALDRLLAGGADVALALPEEDGPVPRFLLEEQAAALRLPLAEGPATARPGPASGLGGLRAFVCACRPPLSAEWRGRASRGAWRRWRATSRRTPEGGASTWACAAADQRGRMRSASRMCSAVAKASGEGFVRAGPRFHAGFVPERCMCSCTRAASSPGIFPAPLTST